MNLNTKKINELIELMNNNDLTEIEIEQEGTKIKLIKRPQGLVEQQVMRAPAQQAQPPAQGPVERPAEEARKLIEVKSPMVGTFYRAAAPDASPYVQVDDIIHKGDVLCVVEAMKLMNEVKSEFDGKIVQILSENAEPIEFGQTMFLIEPI